MSALRVALVVAASLIATGCATPDGGRAGRRPAPPSTTAPAPPPSTAAPPRDKAPRPVQTGKASWYGEAHHGKKTASGEIYDMNEMTAAHRSLPLGARVRVTNVDNDRSVVVRINDRGPYVRGRIIDLSRAAASALGPLGTGVFTVRLEVLEDTADEGPPRSR